MNLEQLTQLYDLSNRTVAITGGAGILGGEIACALVGCGANVAIMDLKPDLADRLLPRLETGPGRVLVVYANVLDRDSLVEAK